MKRYVVATPGRTGSSLLCACMSDAGADFGIHEDDWDRDKGAFEGIDFTRSFEALLKGTLHEGHEWWWHAVCIEFLKKALRFEYLKKPRAEFLIPSIKELGYEPVPIVSIRPFGDTIASRLRAFGGDRRTAEIKYIQSCYVALGALEEFGGCVVDYDDLLSGDAWAFEVERVTGLDSKVLLESRDLRRKVRRDNGSLPDTEEGRGAYDMLIRACKRNI